MRWKWNMKNNRINLRGSDWAAVWDNWSTSGFKELSEQTLTSSVSCFLVEHLWTAVLVLPPGSEILTTCMLDHRDLKLEFNFREEEKVAGSKVWQLKDKVVTNISCPRATAWATVQVADTAQRIHCAYCHECGKNNEEAPSYNLNFMQHLYYCTLQTTSCKNSCLVSGWKPEIQLSSPVTILSISVLIRGEITDADM